MQQVQKRCDQSHVGRICEVQQLSSVSFSPPVTVCDSRAVQAFSRLLWDWDHLGEYQSLLLSDSCLVALAAFQASLCDGDSASAASELQQVLTDVALAVGMRRCAPRLLSRTGRPLPRYHQPWFDDECRACKQAVCLQCACRAFKSGGSLQA